MLASYFDYVLDDNALLPTYIYPVITTNRGVEEPYGPLANFKLRDAQYPVVMPGATKKQLADAMEHLWTTYYVDAVIFNGSMEEVQDFTMNTPMTFEELKELFKY